MKKRIQVILGSIFLLGLAACRPAEIDLLPTSKATPITGALTPYASKTPAQSTQAAEARATLTPAPSPTPQIHVVALDETLISIAYRYGISLEQLQNANPEVNPWALYVGDELVIPYVEAGEDQDPNAAPAPDPEPVELSVVSCTDDASGGVWCLWTATNPAESGTENILVEIVLQDGNLTLSKTVTAPLNISKAGQRVPMGAYFTAAELAGLSDPFSMELTLLQALPLGNTSGRSVPVSLQDGLITIKSDRQSAVITGNLYVTANASRIWMVAAAYDADHSLVGFIRWTQEAALSPDTSLPISLEVFAVGNQTIETVEILLEAHP